MVITLNRSPSYSFKKTVHTFLKNHVVGYKELTTYPLALGKGVRKSLESKINGNPHENAVVNGIIEAEFQPDVAREELSTLAGNAPIHHLL